MAIPHPSLQMATLAQAIALVRIYDRAPIYETEAHAAAGIRQSFEDFVKTSVTPEVAGAALIVHWSGMYLGVEADGYTHS